MCLVRYILVVMLGLVVSINAWAALTPAGTVINNTVTLDYDVAGLPASVTSNTATVTVVELINVVLQWQDPSPVPVNSPDNADALSFLLTNTGNGVETFSITRNNAPPVPDQYNPLTSAISLYRESNGIPGFQSGVGGDAVVTGDLTLNAEESIVLYLLSDTPGALATGNTGHVALTAVSTTAGAAGAVPGTSLSGLGDGGIDAVVGNSRAQATADGIYIVSGLAVNLVKTASVLEGGDAAAGKTLVYTITASFVGSGTASNFVIVDPLPPQLTYVPGSIRLDGLAQTDADDAPVDQTKFVGNTLTVALGDITVTPATPVTRVITLRASVN